ncbi:hypothetical protein COCON_G00148880 [Conger conger]|uniref:Uncharacterized protein n=1 Tax=Conger conger TaxID=82655 RepID=A0A9Q1HVU0_CONCO|nr:hypothetical protein COCON_G00148880 [Conger conger]
MSRVIHEDVLGVSSNLGWTPDAGFGGDVLRALLLIPPTVGKELKGNEARIDRSTRCHSESEVRLIGYPPEDEYRLNKTKYKSRSAAGRPRRGRLRIRCSRRAARSCLASRRGQLIPEQLGVRRARRRFRDICVLSAISPGEDRHLENATSREMYCAGEESIYSAGLRAWDLSSPAICFHRPPQNAVSGRARKTEERGGGKADKKTADLRSVAEDRVGLIRDRHSEVSRNDGPRASSPLPDSLALRQSAPPS